MKPNDTARLLIGSTPATLVTVNRDGNPQVSVVWMAPISRSPTTTRIPDPHHDRKGRRRRAVGILTAAQAICPESAQPKQIANQKELLR